MSKINTKKLLKKEFSSVNKIIKSLENNNFFKLKNFEKLCNAALSAIKRKKKIIFIGNGGSAAEAQHLATELSIKYKKKRKALPGIALSSDTSAITAAGNDFGFNFIFSRQIEAIGNPGDILIALTTSGNSKNLIEACKMAKRKKILTSCFTGNNGGKIKSYTKLPIIIPSKNTSVIQVIELMLGQILCEFLEENA